MAESRGHGTGADGGRCSRDADTAASGAGEAILPADEFMRIANSLWRLRDALGAPERVPECEAAVDELGLALDSLQVSVEELARRAAAAESEIERLETSQSYRIGRAIVLALKSPLLLVRALTGGRSRRLTTNRESRRSVIPRGASLHRERGAAVVCLLVGLPEDAARLWARRIAESAVLGGVTGVFVSERDLGTHAAGFPVVRVVGESEWAHGGGESWAEYLSKRLGSVVRAYRPAQLAVPPGVPGPVAPGAVSGLVRMLVEQPALRGAIQPVPSPPSGS